MNEEKPAPSQVEGKITGKFAKVIRGAVVGGMVVLAAMMLLTTANVVGRYAFNAPIKGTYELVGLLLVCLTAAGLGYCQLEQGHIRVGIIRDRFSQRGQAVLDSLASLVGVAGISLICWYTFIQARKYIFLTRGEVSDILGISYYPFMFILFIGFALFDIMLLINLAQSVRRVIRNE